MLHLDGRAARYGEVWYEETPPDAHGVDILVFRQRRAPIPNARNVRMLSIASGLGLPPDAIAGAFDRECRYEVRRADARDGLSHASHADPAPVLREFSGAFAAFARNKGVEGPDAAWLHAACSAGRLHLTSAGRDGERLVWHAYLRCGGTVRLAHSVSLFRDRDAAYRALVGRANRWLHWRDMMLFQAEGVAHYDWGGLFEDESPAGHSGINRFKRSFGGHQMHCYDCTVGVTLRGRVYLPLRDAWRRYRPPFQAQSGSRRTAWLPS